MWSISTGVYHFPVEKAAEVAVDTVQEFVQGNPGKPDLIEWVLFDDRTMSVYEKKIREFS